MRGVLMLNLALDRLFGAPPAAPAAQPAQAPAASTDSKG